MTTATKKRSKKAQADEDQAKGLNAMPASEPLARAIDKQLVDAGLLPPKEESEAATDEDHRLAEAFRKVAQKNREVQAAQAEYDEAAEEAKTRKKRLEAKQDELSKLIGNHADPAPMPLFDKPAVGAPSQAVMSATDDESWKAVKLDEALPELSATVIKKLNDAMLFTMGELANWTAEDGGRRRLSDIAGIGATTAGKIEEATMAFWARRAAPAEIAAPQVDAARDVFRSTMIPWADLLGSVPDRVSKIGTIGELQDEAKVCGILTMDVIREAGVSGEAYDKFSDWLDEQLDEAEVGEQAHPGSDVAAPLRDFLATPIPWGDFDESPADTTKLLTVADLENQSASVGMGTIDALVNLGMTFEGAQVVVDWLEGCRGRLEG